MVCPGCPEELGLGSGVVGKTPTSQRSDGLLSDGSRWLLCGRLVGNGGQGSGEQEGETGASKRHFGVEGLSS